MAISIEVDADGTALATIDLPGEKVNKFDERLLEALSATLDRLEAGGVRGVVFASGKEGNFLAGADLERILAVEDRRLAEEGVRRGQRLFQRLESLPFPTVAAIDGACLGGGLEFALACRYRVASDAPHTRLGLPEVQLGLLPAWGGTQRLPRAIGLSRALPLILGGEVFGAHRALALGVVQAAPTRERLIEIALDLGRNPVPLHPRRRLLERTRLGRLVLYGYAARDVARRTRGQYPALAAALDCIRTGLEEGRDAGFDQEARLVSGLAVGPVAKNLIRLFFLRERARKDSGPVPAIERISLGRRDETAEVVAQLAALAGIAVEVREEPVRRRVARLLDVAVAKGKATSAEATAALGRVSLNPDPPADLAIEGAGPLGISPGQGLPRLEFFPPVLRSPMVEIARAPDTPEDAVRAAAALVRRLGKLALVVRGAGGLVGRLGAAYAAAGEAFAEECVSFVEVDARLESFGMAAGPFRFGGERGLRPPLYDRRGHAIRKSVRGERRTRDRTVGGEEIVDRVVLALVNESVAALAEGVAGADAIDLATILALGFPPFRGGVLRHAEERGLAAIQSRMESIGLAPHPFLIDAAARGAIRTSE